MSQAQLNTWKKDFLPVSCLSARGKCGWSDTARVEMKGVQGSAAQQT